LSLRSTFTLDFDKISATDLHSSSQLQEERLKEGCAFLSGFNEITVAGSMKTQDGFKAQSVLPKSVHDFTKCTMCSCFVCQHTIRYITMHRPSARPNLDNTEHWQQRVCVSHRFLKQPQILSENINQFILILEVWFVSSGDGTDR